MSPWKTVFLKEVRENVRDKRTMFSTFVLGTLMGPVLFAGLIGTARLALKAHVPEDLYRGYTAGFLAVMLAEVLLR